MAGYNKFNSFTLDLINGIFDFDAHTFKVMLVNSPAPVAGNSIKADLTEISAGAGYTAGGEVTVISTSTASGVAKATATDVSWTATGGSIGPFRYIVVYDDTAVNKPLICWFDFGSSLTVADGNTFAVDFSATNGLFTVT